MLCVLFQVQSAVQAAEAASGAIDVAMCCAGASLPGAVLPIDQQEC